ncbi:ABC transporter permease [Marinifilum caeruleilacunae]|uniref:FtsX-like permease family protein n=1 Tax=Marinifilum caeruleilacunae TaxID=2499076 RepID=A0ABX1WSE9_9BACT|nr:ABC transporter permease [Marinifilum caeruleilacunae]NOU59006.1 FtsX-like permease family protein [Marinifilum caeruleilacunae]
MIWNNLKIAIRNLWRDKVFSLINISGLAIGLACCIIIFLFVSNELSYDKHHKDYQQIYRLGIEGKLGETEMKGPFTANPMAPALLLEFPEVEEAVRMRRGNHIIQNQENIFNENRLFWVDSTFFNIFGAEFIFGNSDKALSESRQMVITRSIAIKYFGHIDVLGKSLKLNQNQDYTISAVIEDCPSNTHFHFEFLLPYFDLPSSRDNFWLNDGKYTYVKLKKGTRQADFDQKLHTLVTKYVAPALKRGLNINYEDMVKDGNYYRFYSRPITDIHLHSHSNFELGNNGDIVNVSLFTIIALMILVIACINFTNLSTAKSSKRAKEIGVRKSLGSSKGRLISQFLFESVLLSLIAFTFAMIIVEFILPFTSTLIGKELISDYISNPQLFFIFLGISIITGLLSGTYAAFFLSSFKPAKVLKGDLSKGKNNLLLRKSLVIFQFSISIFLFIATFTVYKQMQYIQEKKLGFKKENVLVLENADEINDIDSFKERIQSYPGVINSTFASAIPGEFLNGNIIGRKADLDPNQYSFRRISADADYKKTLQLELVEGRFFKHEIASDSSNVLINEAGVKELGLVNPIGEIIARGVSRPLTIIGVVKDMHGDTFRNRILPTIILPESMESQSRLAIRYHANSEKEILSNIQKEWNNYTTGVPFKYYHLNQLIHDLHKEEYATMRTFTVFAFLSIFIAILGLLGLSSYATEQRIKEIGIRKTLGSSVGGIIKLMNKDFLQWILISIAITSPIAYYFMSKWLENFVYRASLDVWIFIASGLLSIVIAAITISIQTWKAANQNPVESLRYE